MDKLCVGRIDYLNIWPLFQLLQDDPLTDCIEFQAGHPSMLNEGLARGSIDVSPSSSYEYLIRAEQYSVLPHLGIGACNEVQSVLFCLPFPFEQLEKHIQKGGPVLITSASAASVALLKVLWNFYWKLPEPQWKKTVPGTSGSERLPFLEIGNHALKIYIDQRPDLYIIDLAREWKNFTGLPFVFALWIVNQHALQVKTGLIEKLHESLMSSAQSLSDNFKSLAQLYPDPWVSPQMIVNYWQGMDFILTPDHMAGLTLFGHYLTQMNLIKGMPVLEGRIRRKYVLWK
ncbi:menaquinone biosynthesis protein [Desulfonatronovibrio magnus]|uniref:menaquinone biosynthesis protein n=1 Tax=Desulfonatronovibrio magnus TaxID=698827 RepID=UPI0005EB5C3C|nr:menaquinone biosynthesis protein [Desulfonatronovibrio magnus]